MAIVRGALPESRPAAGGGAVDDGDGAHAGERLLESLDAYVRTRTADAEDSSAQGRSRPVVRWIDRFWLFALLALLLLIGTLLPDGLLDTRLKGYVDKIVTWFPTTLLVGKWIESPDVLLAWSKKMSYRLGVGSSLTLLLVFAFVRVEIDANVQPRGATVTVDSTAKAVPFRDRFRVLTAVVSDAVDHKHDRTFSVGPWEMLTSGFHVHPDWRLMYEAWFSCPSNTCRVPSAVVLKLRDGSGFDDELKQRLLAQGIEQPDRTTLLIRFTDELQRQIRPSLPSGSYDVEVREPCRQELKPLLAIQKDAPETPYYVQFTCPS